MLEAAKSLGADEQRTILKPSDIPELEHSFKLFHPHIDDVPDWQLPEGPIMDDAGRLSFRNAHIHPQILDQYILHKTLLLDCIGNLADERSVFQWQLALDEVFMNALKHGHKADPRLEVHARYGVVQNQFVVHVNDQGPGFDVDEIFRYDPTDLANIENTCGRGVMLMRSFMCEVLWNQAGNAVLLKKTVSPPTPKSHE